MEIVNPFFVRVYRHCEDGQTDRPDEAISEPEIASGTSCPRNDAKQIPFFTAAVFCFILGLTSGAGVSYAAYEKDPIKATQSKTVAVTEELLQREGDVGPATPTIKHKDTSEFLLKQPYEQAVNEVKEGLGEGKEPWWESWFFWLDDGSEKAEDGRDPSHS